jgi:DNA-binding PadR family transcriptional regulator
MISEPEALLPLSSQLFHILIALADRDQHGYSIMRDVAVRTDGKVRLNAGTLYGLIRRMLKQGMITELQERDRPSPSGDERRRTYRLTAYGRKVAKAEASRIAELLEQARPYGLAPERR